MREEAVSFGDGAALVGVITGPDGPRLQVQSAGVILLNQGMIHRVGPNRIYVKLARRLAAEGLTVLRFDFSGIGDSPPGSTDVPSDLRTVVETRAAMDCLSELRGCDRFILMGICSGAVNSINTAAQDPRVSGVVQINPQFFSRELSSYVEARRGQYWRALLANPRRWYRPLTGQANYRMLRTRLRGLFVRGKQASAAATKVASEFGELTERGVSLLLVYSARDWGLQYFEIMKGGAIDALVESGELRVEMMHGADHTFTPLRSQAQLLDLIAGWTHDRQINRASLEPVSAD